MSTSYIESLPLTTLEALFAFLAAASILTITPGVDTAMVLRSATTGGTRSAIFASVGILSGCLAWGAAASLGLGALLAASELAFTIVKWVGAGYLVYLGLKLILRPRQRIELSVEEVRSSKGTTDFRQGLLTNLLNPKIGIFYITFLPQFIPAGASVATFSFLLAVVHVAITSAWFAILIAATVPMGRFLRRAQVVKMLDRITGGVFIAFGAKLALSR